MSNREIISCVAVANNFMYDGKNLFTFQEWKKRGYTVKKGQKAFITTNLWKSVSYKDKESGEQKSRMIMTKAALFNMNQVSKIN